jgi:hypothetical protein
MVINRRLTVRQERFIKAYKANGDGTKSAIESGYSLHTAPQIASQLLKNPRIRARLESWAKKKEEQLSKTDFVSLAINDYQSLDVTEPNKPRFLDIAGKALGYLGAQTPQTVNNNLSLTQVNVTGNESAAELWAMTRKLMESQ